MFLGTTWMRATAYRLIHVNKTRQFLSNGKAIAWFLRAAALGRSVERNAAVSRLTGGLSLPGLTWINVRG
jgi:hypothetical protein